MIIADWVTLAIILVFALVGLIAGFGKMLKFFTSGIFGIIISIIVCYFIYSIVISWSVTQDLMSKFSQLLTDANNSFTDILLKIKIETILVAVILFIIVQIIRVIFVHLVKFIVEINNPVFKAINKTVGLVFMLATAVMLILIAFQIVSWIGSGTAEKFLANLDGSMLKLDEIFLNNPLNNLIVYFNK